MTSINEITSGLGSSSISQALSGSDVNREQFLTLLVAQLKAQDPFEPLKNEEFLSQLATFSQLEEQQKTTSLLGNLIYLQQAQLALGGLSQGASLVGKHVEYIDPESNSQGLGTVQSVLFDPEGVLLEIDGKLVPAGNIIGVSASPPVPAEPSQGGAPSNNGNSNNTSTSSTANSGASAADVHSG